MNKGIWIVSLALSICVIFLSAFSFKLFEKIQEISQTGINQTKTSSQTTTSNISIADISTISHSCSDREFTPDINLCFAENEEAIEKEVLKRYSETLEIAQGAAANITSEDSTDGAMTSFYIHLPEDLKELDASFKNYMEVRCGIEADGMWGGTGTSSAYNACKIEMYQKYLKDLDDFNWYFENI